MDIISLVCALLAQHNVNILDISQTILRGGFTMVMLVDAGVCDTPSAEPVALLEQEGKAHSLDVRAQWEGIFSAMHRVWGSAEGRRIGELRRYEDETAA